MGRDSLPRGVPRHHEPGVRSGVATAVVPFGHHVEAPPEAQREVITDDRHAPVPRSGRRPRGLDGPSRLVERAKAITERELARYASAPSARRPPRRGPVRCSRSGSRPASRRTTRTRSSCATPSGAHMVDVDGNEYVDYDMGFGALFAGHMHPAVRAPSRPSSTTARCT